MGETQKERIARQAAKMRDLKANLDVAHNEYCEAAQSWAGIPQERLRFELYPDQLRARLDGKWYEITVKQSKMLKVLLAAVGSWTCGKNICDRPDRVRTGMPLELSSIIESHRVYGYRIKPEMFTAEG